MEGEGFDIPIGGDLSGLAQAFESIIASMDKLGATISASFEKSNASIARSIEKMTSLQTSASSATSAQQKTAAAATTTGQKLMTAGRATIALAQMTSGLSQGLGSVATIMSSLSSNNFGTMLTNLTRLGGGFKGAIKGAWIALQQLGTSKSFWKIAAGATAAIGIIIAMRTAWRIAAGGVRLLSAAAAATFRAIIRGAQSAARAVTSAFKGIASMPGRLASLPGVPFAGLISAAAAVALLTTQIKGASGDAARFEDMRLSVEHFTGSVQKANALLSDLQKFSIRTPFTTEDIQATATGLLGAGVRDDVAGITKDLAAMARNGQELREIGDALAKGFSKGKFQTEEVNKFLERGINLNPALQAQLGLTGKAFQKAVEAGLSFETVTAAIRRMSSAGGQFYGLLDKRAGTFNGLISTLVSVWTDVRKAFGAPINDALKPVLQAGIDGIASLMKKAEALGKSVATTITSLFGVFEMGKGTELFKAGLNLAVLSAADVLQRGFRAAVAFIATALPPVIAAAFAKLQDKQFWSGLSLMVEGIGQSIATEIRSALPGANAAQMDLNRQGANLKQEAGGLMMDIAGKTNFAEVIKQALLDGQAAAAKAIGGDKSPKLLAAESAMQKIMNAGLRRVEAEKAADEIFGNLLKSKASAALPASQSGSLQDKVTKAAAPAVMSLTRIGGGGFASTVMNNLVAETRKQTGLLKTIAANTGKSTPSSAFA